MKRFLLAAVFAAAVAGTGIYLHQAAAATTPPDAQAGAPPMPPGPPGPWGIGPHGPGPMMPPPGMMAWHPHDGMHGHDDDFSLFAHVDNKNLTAADVKIIAEAILLEHGNHDWTVTDVTSANQKIDFSYATPHGDKVATFAVDPATGHMRRLS